MTPFYQTNGVTIFQGNAFVLSESIARDIVITDPPFTMQTREQLEQFLSQWNPALVLTNPPPGYFWRGEVVSVPSLTISKTHRHPHERPLDEMQKLIRLTSGHILDPFMGSGATLAAALLEGRTATGIEIEERYCEAAAKRLIETSR